MVDRLLASPHYGERWALKWLDVVRYADTNGFELDADRPHAWRYRDYVIDSFNRDKPYDRFIQEQIAGDEMFPGNQEALIATGYLRAGSEHLVAGNIDPEESRQEVLTEIATNVGQTFLGMTVNCARCHNHKFDPILQARLLPRCKPIFAGAKGKDVEIADAGREGRLGGGAEGLQGAADAGRRRPRSTRQAVSRSSIREERKAPARPQAARSARTFPRTSARRSRSVSPRTPKTQIEPTWDEVVAAMTPADRRRSAPNCASACTRSKRPRPIRCRPPMPSSTTGEAAPQSYVLRLGDPQNRLDPVDPSVPLRAQGRLPDSHGLHRAAHGARQLAGLAGESADRARHGESHLAVPHGRLASCARPTISA